MSRERYEELIEAFCRQIEVDDVAGLLQGDAFRLGGHDVWLDHIELPDQCRVLVDLGRPASGADESIYEAMLESNFDNADDALPVVSLHPETGHAFLALHLPLSSLSSEADLHEILTERVPPLIDFWVTWLNEGELSSISELLPPFSLA